MNKNEEFYSEETICDVMIVRWNELVDASLKVEILNRMKMMRCMGNVWENNNCLEWGLYVFTRQKEVNGIIFCNKKEWIQVVNL